MVLDPMSVVVGAKFMRCSGSVFLSCGRTSEAPIPHCWRQTDHLEIRVEELRGRSSESEDLLICLLLAQPAQRTQILKFVIELAASAASYTGQLARHDRFFVIVSHTRCQKAELLRRCA